MLLHLVIEIIKVWLLLMLVPLYKQQSHLGYFLFNLFSDAGSFLKEKKMGEGNNILSSLNIYKGSFF